MNEYNLNTKFIDLKKQQERIRKKIENSINDVLNHGVYIMGPEVKTFESRLEDYTGSNHALTCANGTDALTLALMAWEVEKGDAVFVPSFTYVASAETPAQLGATPFFVDVEEETFNMCPESFKQAIFDAKELGLKPSTVIPVDLFGYPSKIEQISQIAKENNINLLVDGAQSFGASFKDVKVGKYGDITATSFFPAKPLGCYGDGGAIFTDNDELSYKINSIRLHGKGSEKYDNVRIGINSRLDTIQAAILIEKLNIFPEELSLRQKISEKYSSKLKDFVEVPIINNNYKSAWAQYTIKVKNNSNLKDYLNSRNIPSVVYYPKALSQQSGYSHYPCVSSGVSISEDLTGRVLSLPMHPYLRDEEIDNICSAIEEYYQSNEL